MEEDKKSKKVEVELEIDTEIWDRLEFIASKADVTLDDLISVILTTKLYQLGIYDKEDNGDVTTK